VTSPLDEHANGESAAEQHPRATAGETPAADATSPTPGDDSATTGQQPVIEEQPDSETHGETSETVTRRTMLRAGLLAAGGLVLGGAGGFALGHRVGRSGSAPTAVDGQPLPVPADVSVSFPIGITADRRGFVDAHGSTFHYVADTAWNAISRLNDEDFEILATSRRERGFTALQMSLLDFWPANRNVSGHAPFAATGALDRPLVSAREDDYWKHVDRCLDTCDRLGLVACLVPAWYGGFGDSWRGYLTTQNVATYAEFLAERFGGRSNVWWLLGGDNVPTADGNAVAGVPGDLDRGPRVEHTNIIGNTLFNESAVTPLMTYHTARHETVTEIFGGEEWYQIAAAYSGTDPVPAVTTEYAREPVRPVVLIEAYYDQRETTPILDRRTLRAQAYHSFLSGAAGYSYGHTLVWPVADGWKEALDAASARDITTLSTVLRTFADGPLEPVSEHDGSARLLPTDYYSAEGGTGTTTAALLPEGAGAIAYFGEPRDSVDINTTALDPEAEFNISWVDPSTSQQFFVGGRSGKRITVNWPSPWRDALLVLHR